MAFSDLDITASVGLMVRFSGIPYVFADFAQPTAAGWGGGSGSVTIGGESYTWSRTMHMPRAITASAKYDPNKHRVTAGGVSFDFTLPGTQDPFTTNPWFSLLNVDPFRADGDYSVLKFTLEANTTSSAQVSTTTGWAGAGDFYVGTETIGYASTGATSFITLTRGKYGSKQKEHRSGFSGPTEAATGAYVTSNHTVWRGRTARFWLVRGKTVDGVFVPDATTIEDATTDKLLQYEIVDGKMDGAAKVARIVGKSIEGLLEDQVATRLPRATAGLRPDEVFFRVDDTINTLAWSWVSFDVTNTNTYPITVPSTRLQRDDGGGSNEDVPAGWYSIETLAEYIEWTVFYSGADTPSWFVPATDVGAFSLYLVEDKATFSIGWSLTSAVSGTWEFTFALHGQFATSVLRSVGFTETHATTDQIVGSQHNTLPETEAERKRAQLYLPNVDGATAIRHYDFQSSLQFDTTTGYDDDEGSEVGAYVRIGQLECVKLSLADLQTLTISNRGQLGSRIQEIYVEAGDDPLEVVQGLAFPGVSWPRMLLYLMLGGSGVAGLNDATFDQGWVGSGSYIDASLVDVESFTKAVTSLGNTARDNWAFFQATPLRFVMESEGLLANAVIRQASGLLSLATVTRVMEAETLETPLALTVADQHPDTGRRSYSSGENMISNALELHGAWDHGRDEATHIVEAYEGTSITSYGIRNKQTVDVRGIAGIDALRSGAQDLTAQYFALRGFPRAVFGIPYARAKVWDIAVLDKVTVSDDLLPALSVNGAAVGSTRGFTGALAQVVSARTVLPAISEKSAERGRIEMMTTAKDASRYSYWNPAAEAHARDGTRTIYTCYDHSFSGNETGVPVDASWFDNDRAGDAPVCFVYPVGNYAAGLSATVASVAILGPDLSTITFTGVVDLVPPVVIEFADYDNASLEDNQRRYVYQSDGDHKLDKSAGSDLPYKYN
jgi:hypothetical protein